MNENLKELVNRINEEIRASGTDDMTIKRALVNFVRAYNDIPNGDPAKLWEDNAALELLEIVLGKDNPAISAYIDFYNAAKNGEVSIE